MADIADQSDFVSQGTLDPEEAERLLRRLEKEGIRFQLDIKDEVSFSSRGPTRSSQITLRVHNQDLGLWEKLWAELYPL